MEFSPLSLSKTELKIAFCLLEQPLKISKITNILNDLEGKLPNYMNCKSIKNGLCDDEICQNYGKVACEKLCSGCRRHKQRLYSDSHIYNHIGGSRSKDRLLKCGAIKYNRKKELELCDGCHGGLLINQENKLIYICPKHEWCVHKDVNNGCIYQDLMPILKL